MKREAWELNDAPLQEYTHTHTAWRHEYSPLLSSTESNKRHTNSRSAGTYTHQYS